MLLRGFACLLLATVTASAAQPGGLVWRGTPGGLQTAIADGNPQAAGPFTMLLKLPDGVWIPPHFHNVDKRLAVISGRLVMGHGDVIDTRRLMTLEPGAIAMMPAGEHHYEGGDGDTVVALFATGPFTTTPLPAASPVTRGTAPSPGTPMTCATIPAPTEAAAVRAVAERLIAADNAASIPDVMRSYARAAILWPPSAEPIAGADAIERHYTAIFAAATPSLAIDIASTCVDGGVAVLTGTTTGRSTTRADGAFKKVADRFTMILTRDATTWRVAHLQWTPRT
jgi:ketosteroid isomerase-like protein